MKPKRTYPQKLICSHISQTHQIDVVAARGLVAADAVEGHPEPDAWLVRSTRAPGQQYLVRHRDGWRCTCAWYLRHGTSRGPCKHALAVALATGAVTDVGDTEG